MAGLNKLLWPMLTMLLTLSFSVKSEDLVLVVNQENPTSILSKTQVIDLYMGKFIAFPDGSKAIPIDLADGSDTKAIFYKSLVGMPLARVNAYWSRVKFSGRARPPIETDSEEETIKFIRENENAIAYVHESNVTEDLKVVFRFDE